MIEKNIDVGDFVTVKVRTFPQLASDPTREIKKAQVTRVGIGSNGTDGRTWHMLKLALDGQDAYVPVTSDELRQHA